MNRTMFGMLIVALAVAVASVAARQSSDDDRRAAITVLRAINTAEAAAKRSGGNYLPMTELLDHPAMGKVKPNFTASGNTFTYSGAQVRLALSADATQYIVTVVADAPTYTAAFSDERGVIYTGKALE